MFDNQDNAPVKLTADEDGRVVVPSLNNPDSAYIRVESTSIERSQSGYMAERTRSAIIPGDREALEHMIESQGLSEGDEVGGQIVVKEQVGEPFYPGQDPKINPSTGKIILDHMRDDEGNPTGELGPVYRQSSWYADSDIPEEGLKDDLRGNVEEGEQIAEPQDDEELEATASITS